MEKSFSYVVFDLDGTLVDTIPDIARSFNEVLRIAGYPVHPENSYVNMVGWGLRHTMESALPPGIPEISISNLVENVTNNYREAPVQSSCIYKGIPELLEYLTGLGVSSCIYTNKDEAVARKVVGTLFKPGLFDEVIGKGADLPGKPDVEALFSRIGEEKRGDLSILFVGDSIVDARTASNAGFAFAVAGWGYGNTEEMKNHGCGRIFDRPENLRLWLKNG